MAARLPLIEESGRTAAGRPEQADAGLSPSARIELLCDPGTTEPIRSAARSTWSAVGVDGDGVLAAATEIDGRPVFCFAQDGRVAGGSLGEAHAETLCRVFELAAAARAPVVGFVESAGARVQEGVRSLNGYARIFNRMVKLAGEVPLISISTGASAGGGCYCSALSDFVIMTRGAGMFLTGPKVVEEVLGEVVLGEELGGFRVHQRNGVCDAIAEDDRDAARLARQLLRYLPAGAGAPAPRAESLPPAPGDPGECVPRDAAKVYDVRDVIHRLVDGGETLELAPKWARNIVTGFARLDGRSVGVVANQPRHRGGVIDCEAAQKAARFVSTCDSLGLPLAVLVDTPGFMPGTKQEAAGVIRHGAALLRAFAAARTPKVTVILRQAFGGGYITMNSKELGADMSFAWPEATIGIMGASQAVGVVHRAEIAAAEDPAARRQELAAAYAERQSASVAANDGVIDAVVPSTETRRSLCAALSALAGKAGASMSAPAA